MADQTKPDPLALHAFDVAAFNRSAQKLGALGVATMTEANNKLRAVLASAGTLNNPK